MCVFFKCSLETCFWKDTSLPGNDVDSFASEDDPVKCKKFCKANHDCYAWTVKNGCYLKNENALLAKTVDAGYTSGPKICGKLFEKKLIWTLRLANKVTI